MGADRQRPRKLLTALALSYCFVLVGCDAWSSFKGLGKLPRGVAGFRLGQGYWTGNLNALVHLRTALSGTNVRMSDLEWRFFVPALPYPTQFSSISLTLSNEIHTFEDMGKSLLFNGKTSEINACTGNHGALLSSGFVRRLPKGPGVFYTEGNGAKYWFDGSTLIKATDNCITFNHVQEGSSHSESLIGGGDSVVFVGGSIEQSRMYPMRKNDGRKPAN